MLCNYIAKIKKSAKLQESITNITELHITHKRKSAAAATTTTTATFLYLEPSSMGKQCTAGFSQAGCPFCHLIISIKALKGKTNSKTLKPLGNAGRQNLVGNM